MTAGASTPCLLLRQQGQFITLQDGGRVGWKRFGVPGGGAMDPMSLAVANTLVGNPPLVPGLEFMFVGGEYELDAEAGHLAVAGGSFPVFHNGERVSAHRSIRLARGDVLRIGAAQDAVWGYLAAAGGFAARLQLGSASTHVPSGIGGFTGRALRVGDAIPLACPWPEGAACGKDHAFYAPRRPYGGPIRVVLGPQETHLEPASVEAFLSEQFVVTHQIDRMGYNLLGPKLSHKARAEIVSDGVVPGNIQVPGSGQLIALLADCQPTGGYPKIATVLSADLGRLSQNRPGSAVRFRAVTVEEAHRVRLDFLQRFAQLSRKVVPMPYEPV